MQRITVTLDDDLLADLDAWVARAGHSGRSEAMRDLLRAGLSELAPDAADDDCGAQCVGALVYVYEHERRELAQRLVNAHHHHHDLSLATTHVHLDQDRCLEVALLRGHAREVRHFAEHLIAERGVQHGRLVLIPAHTEVRTHAHGASDDAEPRTAHAHTRVGRRG